MTPAIRGLSLDDLKKDFATWIPGELVDLLLGAYEEIKENHLLGKHEPTELNAGKLCEVVFRILEFEASGGKSGGKYTKIGVTIKPFDQRCRNFENATAANDAVRFHIPRVATAVYNVRNKRGVGHVGGDVSPNLADATLVATAADWIMAELIRLHYSCTLDQAQRWVDGLVQRKLPLVYEIGSTKRVLNPRLSFSIRVLLLLSGEFPASLTAETLFEWTEHSNPSAFRKDVLMSLHKKKLIEYADPMCAILPPGLKLVEQKFTDWAAYEPTLAAKPRR